MEHHGQNFGVDCFKLWECGTMDLPAFADRIVQSADEIAGVDGAAVYVGGGAGTRSLVSSWVQLAVDLRGAMNNSVANIYAACDAVIQIAQSYANQDDAAKAEFLARRTDEISKHAGDPVRTVFDTPSSRPQIVTAQPGQP